MKRIRLNSDEKKALRRIALGKGWTPDCMPADNYTDAVISLTEKKLTDSIVNYDTVEDVKLTVKGRAYLNNNPHLYNPIDWKWVVLALFTAMTAIATTVALFIACGRI